jgi:hypothetical protein
MSGCEVINHFGGLVTVMLRLLIPFDAMSLSWRRCIHVIFQNRGSKFLPRRYAGVLHGQAFEIRGQRNKSVVGTTNQWLEQQISGWNNKSVVGTTNQWLEQQISGWNNFVVAGNNSAGLNSSGCQVRSPR